MNWLHGWKLAHKTTSLSRYWTTWQGYCLTNPWPLSGTPVNASPNDSAEWQPMRLKRPSSSPWPPRGGTDPRRGSCGRCSQRLHYTHLYLVVCPAGLERTVPLSAWPQSLAVNFMCVWQQSDPGIKAPSVHICAAYSWRCSLTSMIMLDCWWESRASTGAAVFHVHLPLKLMTFSLSIFQDTNVIIYFFCIIVFLHQNQLLLPLHFKWNWIGSRQGHIVKEMLFQKWNTQFPPIWSTGTR